VRLLQRSTEQERFEAPSPAVVERLAAIFRDGGVAVLER
jgi:hypothetical protein